MIDSLLRFVKKAVCKDSCIKKGKQVLSKQEISKAIPSILVAGAFLAAIGFFSKAALAHGSIFWVLLTRSCMNLIVVTPIIYKKKHRVTHLLRRPKRNLLYARGVFSTAAAILLIWGSFLMPISINSVLFCTAPLFVPFIVRFWLKVPIVGRLWWGLSMAFLGIVLILHPLPREFHLVSIIPLAGGILAAIATVIARKLIHTDPPEIIIFYLGKISLVITLLFLLDPATYHVKFSLNMLLILLSLGLCFFAYQFFFTFATKHATARFVSPFLYSSTLFSLIPEIYFFHKTPSALTLLGVFFVILGTVLNVVLFPKEKKESNQSPKSHS